jgi:hypothetical protein
MDGIDTPLGLALVAVGIFVLIKAVKSVVKLAMLVVIGIGLYYLLMR